MHLPSHVERNLPHRLHRPKIYPRPTLRIGRITARIQNDRERVHRMATEQHDPHSSWPGPIDWNKERDRHRQLMTIFCVGAVVLISISFLVPPFGLSFEFLVCTSSSIIWSLADYITISFRSSPSLKPRSPRRNLVATLGLSFEWSLDKILSRMYFLIHDLVISRLINFIQILAIHKPRNPFLGQKPKSSIDEQFCWVMAHRVRWISFSAFSFVGGTLEHRTWISVNGIWSKEKCTDSWSLSGPECNANTRHLGYRPVISRELLTSQYQVICFACR